jgi:hypothetical protein
MKKLMLVAICAMAVMISCKNKGQTAPADSNDSLNAVIDSIIEENDTTPLPMFLVGNDSKYMQMLYWTDIEEPKKGDDDDDYFEASHKRWELQEMFRRNAALYTNLIVGGDKITKVKFIDEVLKDPDGNRPSIGQIHGRDEIPSLCARFDYANAKDKKGEGSGWGTVIVTDSYLNTRRLLPLKSCAKNYEYPKLDAAVVKQLEKEYGMKAKSSSKIAIIDNRYIHGTVEFEGEYKNAPKDPDDPDRKFGLAVELLIDSAKVYKLEELGYYSPEWGSTWNADADGYISNDIVAAFEGPKGLELCYTHGAPESFCIGMIYLRDGKLIEHQYEMFQTMVDEEIPVWKRDIAEMRKLYVDDSPNEREDVKLTKYAFFYLDYDNQWIWMRDQQDENGAFFLKKDGKFKLIAVETPKMKPSTAEKDGVGYLRLSGSAGGPSQYVEIYAFKDGKRKEYFTALFVAGEIDGCGLNDRDISVEAGKAYLAKLPKFEEMPGYFKNIEEE